jgi:hypothetical protein
MTSANFSKDTESRQKETERLKAETARSLEVVEMKKAHRKIEELEKERKQAGILSVWYRLNSHVDHLLNEAKGDNDLIQGKKFSDLVRNNRAKSISQMYESVRFDFKKTLDLKDEEFNVLFPALKIETETDMNFLRSVNDMALQEIHMQHYCKRYFP